MKKTLLPIFLLILLFISSITFMVNALSNTTDVLLVNGVPVIQETNNFKVTWTLVQELPYIINVSIQNLNLIKQDIDIESVFSNLDTDDLEVTGFYEWKNVTYENEMPITETVEIDLGNGTIISEEIVVDYQTITTIALEWKPCKTRLFSKTRYEYKESYETINIPKLYSKNKGDTVNGTKFFQIRFNTPMKQLGEKWGSKGTIALKINNDIFDPSWLTGWDYRKSHLILNATGAGTNYQINVTAYYGSGSDSGDIVYLDSHSQTDFDDIRFTDNDGETLLDYWTESYVDSSDARFWFEVQDDLSSSNVTIYMYYGNDEVSSATNGTDTFQLFDHFYGSSLNTTLWNSAGSVSVSGSKVLITGTGNEEIYSKTSYGIGTAIRGYGKLDDKANFGSATIGYNTYMQDLDDTQVYSYDKRVVGGGSLGGYSEKNNNAKVVATGDVESSDYKIFNVMRASTDLNQYEVDTFGVKNITTSANIPVNPYPVNLWIRYSADINEFDWILVRKYVYVEPLNDEWGEEEENAFYVIFYNQSNSVFMVDGIKKANGTQTEYGYNTIIELQGIINVSTQFIEYDIGGDSIETNPYNYTVTINITIWLITDTVAVDDGGIVFLPSQMNALPLNLLFYVSITTIGLVLLFKTEYIGKIIATFLFAFLAVWVSNDVLLDINAWYTSSYNVTSGLYQYVTTVTHIDTPILMLFTWLNIGFSLISGMESVLAYQKRKD